MLSPKLLWFGSTQRVEAILSLFPQLLCCGTEAELFVHIQESYPHIIFLADHNPQQTILCTSKIRSSFPEVDIPIVILSSNEWTDLQKNSLSILNQSYRISPLLSTEQIANQIDLLLDMNYFDRSDERCHPHPLGVLIQVFREEKNGILSNSHRTLDIRDGGVISYNAEEELMLFLQEDGPCFTPSTETGLGDWLLVMDLIWKELSKFVMPGFLSQRKTLNISCSTQNDKLFALPLQEKTLAFLFETDPQKNILDRLRELQMAQSEIESDIEMLYRLGFCRFVLSTQPTQIPNRPLALVEVEDEEQGWNLLSSITSSQSIRTKKASGHFWQAILQKEQSSTAKNSHPIIKALQKNDLHTAYFLLWQKKKDGLSWEELALVSWLQEQMTATKETSFPMLSWIHTQAPTNTSAILLALVHSEQKNFQEALIHIENISTSAQASTQYAILRTLLQRETPIPRGIIYKLL